MDFYAEGFTCQELVEAEAILNPLRTKEEIERMYFYSGGSALQYYGFVNEIHALCDNLDRKISAVPHDESFFRAKVEQEWSWAVNELSTYRMKRPVLVSEYVVRRFVHCCDQSFIHAATNPFIGDLSWQSSVVHLEFFWVLNELRKHENTLILKQKIDSNPLASNLHAVALDRSVSKIWKFNSLDQIQPASLLPYGHLCAHETLYVPEQYYDNSGGYDAIYVFYDRSTTPVTVHVDVLQITMNKERSKGLESVGAFLQCLFPRDQPEVQFPHQMVVRYLTVSNYANGRRFDMSGGALSGEEEV
jgi:hypothetical protein